MTHKFVFLWNLKADFILGWWSNHHCPVSHDEYSYQTHREWMVQILEDSEVNSSRQIARADPDEKYQHVSSRVPLFLWYPQTWAESSGRHHVVLGQEWEREFLTFTESKFSFFFPMFLFYVPRVSDSTVVSILWHQQWQQEYKVRELCVCVCMLRCFICVQLFMTPRTVACQTPLSMGFSWEEYWSGLPCPPPGDLPCLGIETVSPASQADSLQLSHWGSPKLWGSRIFVSN